MLQYKIPQNVGIEDKIVGPFSLRQLIILAIGAGISYLLFVITSRIYELNVLEYIIIAVPALIALAVAMLKIHNVTFGKFVLLLFEFAIKPKRRMWNHRGILALVDPDLTNKSAAKSSAQEKATTIKEDKNVNLADLTSVLDSGGFEHIQKIEHEDIDEAKDDDLITEAYFGHKRAESQTENMYWRTKDMQKKKLDILAKMPKAQKQEAQKTEAVPKTQAVAIPTKSEAPKKNGSVVEGLASVIKEAHENNQQKKKRPRKRKPKVAAPARQNTQVDSTNKKEPIKLVPTTTPPKKEEETSLNDLKSGKEIEFNLD